MQTTTCKRAACGLAVPPYQRAKPIYLPSNATDACSGGLIKTQLYAACCCFFAIGEYNPIQSNLISIHKGPLKQRVSMAFRFTPTWAVVGLQGQGWSLGSRLEGKNPGTRSQESLWGVLRPRAFAAAPLARSGSQAP